jgi:hypothetical protein
MSMYRTKPIIVTAMQATEHMQIKGKHTPLHVEAGDWVVRYEDDETRILSDKQFQQDYEPLPSSADNGTPYVYLIDDAPVTLRGTGCYALFPAKYACDDDGTPRSSHREATIDEIARGAWIDDA